MGNVANSAGAAAALADAAAENQGGDGGGNAPLSGSGGEVDQTAQENLAFLREMRADNLRYKKIVGPAQNANNFTKQVQT